MGPALSVRQNERSGSTSPSETGEIERNDCSHPVEIWAHTLFIIYNEWLGPGETLLIHSSSSHSFPYLRPGPSQVPGRFWIRMKRQEFSWHKSCPILTTTILTSLSIINYPFNPFCLTNYWVSKYNLFMFIFHFWCTSIQALSHDKN